jgi:hypothetical protein
MSFLVELVSDLDNFNIDEPGAINGGGPQTMVVGRRLLLRAHLF